MSKVKTIDPKDFLIYTLVRDGYTFIEVGQIIDRRREWARARFAKVQRQLNALRRECGLENLYVNTLSGGSGYLTLD